MRRTLLLAAVLACLPAVARAQQRPLVTEDPETIGAGRVLLETGVDYGRGVEYPVSGLTGQLLRVPLIGVSIGISSIAELQFDGGLYNRLTITERDPAALRMRIRDRQVLAVEPDHARGPSVPEIRGAPASASPATAAHASNERIGLDTTDFPASLLVGKTVRSVRTVINGGFGILGDLRSPTVRPTSSPTACSPARSRRPPRSGEINALRHPRPHARATGHDARHPPPGAR
jgi:hypothetical protein